MNKLGMVALALSAACGGYLVGRLSATPELGRGGSRYEAELTAKLGTIEAERVRLERELAALRDMPARADPAVPSGPAGATTGYQPRVGRVSPGSMRPFELRLEHKKTMARQAYGQLFRELALSDEEVEALVAVLSTQEQSSMLAPRSPLTSEQQEREQREIAAVLGPERAAQFERLKKTIPARTELSLARSQLERFGEPLSDEQHGTLFAILNAREPSAPPPALEEDIAPAQRMEQFRSWRRASSARFRESAAQVLTPRQLERLDESEALLEAMQAPAAGSAAPVPARTR